MKSNAIDKYRSPRISDNCILSAVIQFNWNFFTEFKLLLGQFGKSDVVLERRQPTSCLLHVFQWKMGITEIVRMLIFIM